MNAKPHAEPFTELVIAWVLCVPTFNGKYYPASLVIAWSLESVEVGNDGVWMLFQRSLLQFTADNRSHSQTDNRTDWDPFIAKRLSEYLYIARATPPSFITFPRKGGERETWQKQNRSLGLYREEIRDLQTDAFFHSYFYGPCHNWARAL